jgi:peptide/nickel transport system substrate-binding protein
MKFEGGSVMKKLLTALAFLSLSLLLVATSCTTDTTVQTSSTLETPKAGGILKVIKTYGATTVGYPPNDGDMLFAQVLTEQLLSWDADGNVIPALAETWDLDPVANTLTFHLVHGVYFTDGTPFNAEAAKWNLQQLITAHRMPDAGNIISMDAIDQNTLKLTLQKLTSQAIVNYGWVGMYSPTAYQLNGAEWAESHTVGIGPFMMSDYKIDDYFNYQKVANYWRTGYPYLDGINDRVIPDPVSAEAMMIAGQADLWFNVPVKYAVSLENRGLKVNWTETTGSLWSLFANTVDDGSIFKDKLVREALEYAINRPALAQTLGYGKYEALTQLAPNGSTGYNEGYDPRPYNPEKAIELLTLAGYADGFDTTLVCSSDSQDLATAIQADLAAVGIRASIDLADFARYVSLFANGALGGPGFTDLIIGNVGIDMPFATSLLRHFGPTPMMMVNINGAKSAQFLADCEEVNEALDTASLTIATKKAVRQAAEDALVLPLVRAPWATVMQTYVHDDSNLIHNIIWNVFRSWMANKP